MASLVKWISAAVACVLMAAGPCAAGQAPAPRGSSGAPPVIGSAIAPAAATAPVTDANYVLGEGDTIAVSVLGQPYTGGGRIDADGKIQLQYLGSVKVSEKTAPQVADMIGQALTAGGYYNKPIVKVDIVNYASRYVTVLGAVGTPGLVPVDRAYRVSEILAKVGGVKETAADYLVLTPVVGPARNLLVKELATGGAAQDPYVQPGDKLYSPLADTFYISGEVKTPTTMILTPGLTVEMAIAKAGGLTDLGTNKGIKITRNGKTIDRVNLNDKVQPGDIVTIKQRLF
jgi:polysaccharide export outer membrane protein